ncbi:MAG TPA: HAMP domain-containing sensor histidine kinase [Bryobacteraceae bacterium]|jgi:signal transduction histidine kinase
MNRFRRQALYSWAVIAALAGLSVLLAVLQYGWIGEVSRAEEVRLKANLHTALDRLANDFNDNISRSVNALTLRGGEVPADSAARERLYIQKFIEWREGNRHDGFFTSIVRIIPNPGDGATLRLLDQQRLQFRTIDWPANWAPLRDEIERELTSQADDDRGPRRPPRFEGLDVILVPVFDSRSRQPFEWDAFELDLNYVRSALMPELMDRLTRAVGPGYDAELVSRGDPSTVIYQSAPDAHVRIDASTADAQVGLFDVRPRIPPPPDRPREGGSPEHAPPSRPMMPPPARGRWLLSVRHQAGSLDALVARTRLRNIMVTTAVLVLMLLTIAALVRFTRRAQALSELQMQFVAGVSHELRTPLTVIRTAAHNLTTGIVKTGDVNQVQRYGRLIGSETEKLTAIVEQVLAFANSEAGRAIRKREPVAVESLIQQSLADCGTAIADAQCVVESTIAADVVPLWGDPTALRHALQNLLNNAAKYGAEGHWIGVSAAMAAGPKQQPLVEIRVADRGAGIPADERSQIFDPFYRGRRAIDDQVHGTGLGLALVKRIVEAHGGTIGVEPGPDQRGAEFTVRIPAAPPEELDEFADTTGRR